MLVVKQRTDEWNVIAFSMFGQWPNINFPNALGYSVQQMSDMVLSATNQEICSMDDMINVNNLSNTLERYRAITKNEQLKLLNPLKVHWIAKTAKIQAPEKKQKIFLSSLLIAWNF